MQVSALTSKQGIKPQVLPSGATNGSGVNVLEAYSDILAVLNTGAVAGTNPTLDVKIQDSTDNSTFADVTGMTFTQVTAADQIQNLVIPRRSVKKYIRAVCTVGGTSTPTVAGSVTFAYKKSVI